MNTLLDLTINNPIFITVSILIIWFAPGIILRMITEKRYRKKEADERAQKIAKLYPKSK